MSSGRVTKKVKQGKVEIDFEDSALLVNYELETVRVDEGDRPMEVLDRKSEMRRIKIKSLSADKNMAQLAADIVDKCKYIHPSRTEEIEQLLLKLRKHALTNPTKNDAVSPPTRSIDEPVIPQYDRISGNGARGQIVQEPSNVRRTVASENLSGMYSVTSGNNAPPPRNTNAFGLNSSSGNSNNVAASQSRDRGERERDRDRDRGDMTPKDYDNRDRERDRGDRNDRGGDRDRNVGGYSNSNNYASNDRERERDRDRDRGGDRERDREKEQPQRPPQKSALDLLPPAYMNSLDDYLEMLYQVSGKNDKEREEGLAMQERGTSMILKLCLDVVNLEQLIQNGTVMGALTRVLEEEFKKSVDLTFNILRIFLAFSNFVEMHSIMSQYRIGVLTIKAIDYEIKRTEVREQEKIERDNSYVLDLQNIKENQHQMSSQEYSTAMEKLRRGKERDAQKSRVQSRKQDKLLFVAFYILLNLAEDLSIERKMIKKSLIPMLSRMLWKGYADLLILIVTFLKKLSTIEENKETMKESNVLEVMSRYIPCDSPPLVNITLRFLFNLSFDRDLREQMIRYGYVPKLIGLLKTSSYRGKTLKLLYHLSVDDYCKSLFNNDGAMDQIKGLIINFPGDNLAKELAALTINLTYNAKNVELLVANKGLNLLIDRLHDKRQDLLLIKIIRNISLWTFNSQTENENGEVVYNHRGMWSPHIKLLMELARDDNQDIQLEAFGILANMTTFDLPSTASWSKLLKDFGLLAIFARLLVPGMTQNDMLLELIMLISTIASDAQACSVFASSTMIGLLHQVWKDKSEDVEILLQLLHCFHKFFCHKEAREEAMYSTRVVVNIIDCLSHRNLQVRVVAEKIAGIVFEQDRKANGEPGDLGKEIIKKRFESYNKIWLANNMFVSADTMGTITRNDRSRGNSYDYNTAGGYSMGGNEHLMYEPEQIGGGGDRYYGNHVRTDEDDHDDSGSYNNFNYK